MSKHIIEVDIDGVIANIHGALGERVKDIHKGFDGDSHISTWGMKELNSLDERLRPRIFTLFGNPEFIKSLKVYDGVLGSFKLLSRFCSSTDLEILVNTNVFKGCEEARVSWLNELKEQTGADFRVIVASDSPKKMLDSSILIEDHIDNLLRSNAPYKIMIRRGHNRAFQSTDLKASKEGYVVNSFSDAVRVILSGVRFRGWLSDSEGVETYGQVH